MITQVGDVLLIVTAVLAAACVVTYQVTTRGAWWDSPVGRHLMAFMASVAAVSVLGAARVVAVDILHRPDPEWFQTARAAVFASVPVVLAWRLALIIGAARHRIGESVSAYRKWYVAIGGAALTGLGALADATDHLPLPEAWRPWAAVVVALATALGVRRVPNTPSAAGGRHEAPGGSVL